MIFLGIDPGVSGGMAALFPHGQVLVQKLDVTEHEIAAWLRSVTNVGGCFAVLEHVMAAPRVDKATGTRHQMGASGAFAFGQSYGFLRGCLISLAMPFDEVRPQKWQGFLNCRTGGDKNVSKGKASQLFPAVKCTHAISDALLLAEYARRTWSQASSSPGVDH